MTKNPVRAAVVILMWLMTAAAAAISPVDAATWSAAGQAGFADGQKQGVCSSYAKGGLILAFTGDNLLRDPGFEAPPQDCPQMADPYSRKPHLPEGWQHNALCGKDGAVRAAPAARSGGAWELIDTVTPGEPALLQFVAFKPEYRGKSFVFRVWARTRQGTNPEVMIALKFKSTTHWRNDVQQVVTVGPQWKRYSVNAVAPKDADELGVVIGPSSYQGQGAVVVDDAYLAAATYGEHGVYVSEVHDMGKDDSVAWRVACRAEAPEGTAVELLVRTGGKATPDGQWSAWEKVDNNENVAAGAAEGRYLQYQARLRTSRPDRTAVLREVRLDYGARLGYVAGKIVHGRTGAPVPGAVVTLNELSTPCDRTGGFRLGIPAGESSGTVRALRYLSTPIPARAIEEGQRIRLDLQLRPDPSWPAFRGGPQRQGYSALSGSLAGFGVVWEYPLGTTGGGQVFPADLDGDGRGEFLLAKGGSLGARRLDGELLWQVDGWEIGSILGVFDLLGNGQKQVIGLSAGWQPYANGALTVVDAKEGKVLSRIDTWPDAGDIGHGDTKDHLHGSFSPLERKSCVVADLDSDGKLEIMVHPNYHSALMTFHFHDGLHEPRMMWKTQERFKYDLYLYGLAAADTDGDGRPEIVFHDHDLIRTFDGRTGRQKSAADMGCPRALFGLMTCGDVDSDGTAEVVLIPRYYPKQTRNTVALASWDGKALVRRWSRDFDQPVKASGFAAPLNSPLADTDGDGTLEVIVQIGPDIVVLQGDNGKEKWRIASATLKEAADLDADGTAEIIVNKADRQAVYNGRGEFGRKDVTYPADWGWHDWGDGELSRLRGAAGGQTEIVDRAGRVKATLPGTPYTTSAVVADLEGDGKMEIFLRDPQGIIRVLDGSGGEPKPVPFPQLKCDRPGEFPRGGGITVCDLEGDGKVELIFRHAARLVVANSDGSVRFTSREGGRRFPVVGHFDADGVKDVACFFTEGYTSFRGQWTAYSGADGKVIWQSAAQDSNEVGAWDVDGDGLSEIAGKMGPVFLIDGSDGRTLWTAHRREQCALGLGTFADLDGDGRMEILISGEYSNTAWYPDGKCMWWIGWSSGGAKEHYGAVADVNGDGAKDFALSSNHGVLYCVDGRDGREIWTFKIPRKVSLSHPAAADLDGDGRVEFVFGTNTGRLIIVNGEDGSPAATVDFQHPVGIPVIADANGDGLAEVLVTCGGKLYCLSGQ